MEQGIGAGIGKGLVCLAMLATAGFGQTPTKEFIYLGGRLVAVENSGAIVTVSPSAATLAAAGGSGTFTVSAPPGVSWTAAVGANDSWLTATVSGTNVNFSAGANTGTVERQGQITIGGTVVTVTQQGAGAGASGAIVVSTEIFLVPITGGTPAALVEAPAGVAWTASVTSGAPWLTITAGGSGTGQQFLQMGVLALTGGGTRVGTVTVSSAGRPSKIITVYQWPAGPAPANADVSPNNVTEQSKTFTFTASNAAGGAYVGWIQVIAQLNADARDACYLHMSNTDNRVYLREDTGVNWIASGRIGEDVILENTQCSVNLVL